MNEQPQPGPFTTSTLTGPDEAPENNFEDRKPAAQATGAGQSTTPTSSPALLAILVPGALIFSGFAGCTVLWLVSNGNPVMRTAGVIVLLSDLAVAAFLRYLFLKRLKEPRA